MEKEGGVLKAASAGVDPPLLPPPPTLPLTSKKKNKVEYHTARGRITASSRTFGKDGLLSSVTVDPLAEAPTESELQVNKLAY